jgi:hypothetical protein
MTTRRNWVAAGALCAALAGCSADVSPPGADGAGGETAGGAGMSGLPGTGGNATPGVSDCG